MAIKVRTMPGQRRMASLRAPCVAHRTGGEGVTEVFPLFGGFDEEMSWQERALCAQTDPESFFPEKGGSTREAKRVCLACEVKAECLEYALAHDERFGIWGGLSERERRRLKKKAA
jgi:WhiB family redox-sensing transcriptional regulator